MLGRSLMRAGCESDATIAPMWYPPNHSAHSRPESGPRTSH